jgi:membrane protein DedA with SNARE-associated domain
MDFTGHLLGLLTASPWALAALAALLIVDGFFPFVPGETLVVGVSAATAAAGGNPWPLLAVAVPASLAGDLIAYGLGRRIRLAEWRVMRRPKAAAVFAYVRRRLDQSPASILLTAKFVPVVRSVVPMTAGAGRMPLRRYLPLTVVSVTAYTAFHVAVGAAAAAWLPNPAIALVSGVVVAALFGTVLDLVAKCAPPRGQRRQSLL